MIVVRLVFQVKMGESVNETVEGIKSVVESIRETSGATFKVRILTDLSGPFNTIVQEMELESLAAWEQLRAALFASPELREQQADAPMPFEAGRTEFYTLEATY